MKQNSHSILQLLGDNDFVPLLPGFRCMLKGSRLKKPWTVERLRLRAPGLYSVTESLNWVWGTGVPRRKVTAPKGWGALKSKSLTVLNLSGEYINLSPVSTHWKAFCSLLFTVIILVPKPQFHCIKKHLHLRVIVKCMCYRDAALTIVHFLLLNPVLFFFFFRGGLFFNLTCVK